ncbi:MAG TPA: GNAT family N-acetyltransferase [Armatimonadetes bacterium]|nr:GNAT family N-acetyltransferase [Armatimonadota bacterium]
MSVHNLDAMFKPQSIALVGASNRPGSVGFKVMRNLLEAGFSGPIMPVNPRDRAISGVTAYRDVAELPFVADLAVLCIPAPAVPDVIEKLGQQGTRAAVIISAGLIELPGKNGGTLQDDVAEIARGYGLRIVGPNCLGVMVPGSGLNASFSHIPCLPGNIAFLSQSGGLATAVLDYALTYDIGMSHFVSLGNIIDVEFPDVIDYLADDDDVAGILLYIEMIQDTREFISAARAASRKKPIFALKSGRFAEGAKAATSHTGALAGVDAVYDAGLRRAGVQRIYELEELLDVVQTVGRAKPLRGERLAILTNGGGPAVCAVDALVERGGKLAEISDRTLNELNEKLPAVWSHSNPVDIIGDATGQRYVDSIEALKRDDQVDAAIVMLVPTAVSDIDDIAKSTVEACRGTEKTILTSWMGSDSVRKARQMFADANMPTFTTPDRAVRAFMHLVNHNRLQQTLYSTPSGLALESTPDRAAARAVIEGVLASGRDLLTEAEAKEVMAAYNIPVVQTQIVANPEEAASAAKQMGFPVVLKIHSVDITHKSDAGGVILNLRSAKEVLEAATRMNETIAEKLPQARLEGFTVQQMIDRPSAIECIVGVSTDHDFGPTIMFGSGGKSVEVVKDSTITIPPINMALAHAQIERTRIYSLLRGYRDVPPSDINGICLTLCRISDLVVDCPEILELDINPLLADNKGVIALDARIKVAKVEPGAPSRLSIAPYPSELIEEVTTLRGKELTLRPIRAEDEPKHLVFINGLSDEDMRNRFARVVRNMPHQELAQYTQIDYDREMAFVAVGADQVDPQAILGVARAKSYPGLADAEFFMAVRSDMQGQGIGWVLFTKLLDYLTAQGYKKAFAHVHRGNKNMLKLAGEFGFTQSEDTKAEYVLVTKDLQ